MAPAPSEAAAQRLVGFCRRTQAPRHSSPPASPPPKKYKHLSEIMMKARYAVIEEDDYSDVTCEQCGSGERSEELILCDKCDKGFHMKCVRPIVSGKLLTLRIEPNLYLALYLNVGLNLISDAKKRRKRSRSLVLQKRRRRLIPFIPTEDPAQRLKQMGSLASALTALNMEFSDDLTYMTGMAPRSANQAMFENGGMQVLSKEDTETLEHCRAMCRRGEWPPLMVVFDSCEGYTVQADGPIKDLTVIAEYTGDVDFIKNREHDDCDSMMTLLLATDSSKSLVVCPDKRGNIARFINGINNHTQQFIVICDVELAQSCGLEMIRVAQENFLHLAHVSRYELR
ncbi:putative Histone-lysine N-methyltransferase ATXR5 [Senna tora]|uniref:Putative Histone-lysine N-methyltransferase ATXR5 n=1 Tax=Senna tora TaxID=362788 RepID=A0A834WXF5_9FABA|nr:putative Histone-lysine N-methyltransferase ATXR5 [Senna tora]